RILEAVAESFVGEGDFAAGRNLRAGHGIPVVDVVVEIHNRQPFVAAPAGGWRPGPERRRFARITVSIAAYNFAASPWDSGDREPCSSRNGRFPRSCR